MIYKNIAIKMKRSRITISIDSGILGSVDALIDGTKIKNRSHAIESILMRSLAKRKIRKAVILAGGEGIKNAKGDKTVSRVLSSYGGKYFVEHIFDWMRGSGIEEVIICGSGFSKDLQAEIGSGERFGLHISYSDEDKGTASALRSLINRIDEAFLMMNGDVLAKVDLEKMFEFHKKNQGICTLGMISVQKPAAFGNIVLSGNRIADFIEKPRAGDEESYLVNAGIYIMEPEIFNSVSPRHSSLEKDLFPNMARSGNLCGYYIQEKWISLNTIKKNNR